MVSLIKDRCNLQQQHGGPVGETERISRSLSTETWLVSHFTLTDLIKRRAWTSNNHRPLYTIASGNHCGLPSVTSVWLRRVVNAAVRFVYIAGLGPRDQWSWTWIATMVTDWTTHRIRKLCVIVHSRQRHRTEVHLRLGLGRSGVWTWRARAPAQRRSGTLYDVPRTRTRLGSNAFSVAGPSTARNNLSPSIRDISSAAAFKSHLKTGLFECAHIDTGSI